MEYYNLVSEDHRRALYELGAGGNWAVLKVVIVKAVTSIGNHYHKNKRELFLLLEGRGNVIIDGKSTSITKNSSILIEPMQMHSFILDVGSVLLCLASKDHDPTDDYKI